MTLTQTQKYTQHDSTTQARAEAADGSDAADKQTEGRTCPSSGAEQDAVVLTFA